MSSLLVLPLLRIKEPETILYNGNIWTLDEAQPRAEAVAVSGARFVAVGSNTEVLRLASARTRKIDLGSNTVFPGFNDAHAHPVASGVEHLRRVACDTDSIDKIKAALQERALKTPPGEWVLGFLYDDAKTPRPISRHDLDEAVPDHPVIVQHRGGHTAFVNSPALQLAHVNDQTPDPAGGRFEHDAEGHLTGFVGDVAMQAFLKLIPDKTTREDFRQGAALISKLFASKGVTSACDADAFPEDVQGYQDARDASELKMRVYCHVSAASLDPSQAVHFGLYCNCRRCSPACCDKSVVCVVRIHFGRVRRHCYISLGRQSAHSDSAQARRQLLGFSISAKRYALYERREEKINIVDPKAHGLGYLYPPGDSPKGWDDEHDAPEWIYRFWETLLRIALKLNDDHPGWLKRMQMMRITITTYNVLTSLHEWEGFRPYNFLLLPILADGGYPANVDPKRFTLVAPFESDQREMDTPRVPKHQQFR